MRVAWAMLVAASCGVEPTLIGKLCSPDRPCPAELFCNEGVCAESIERTATLSLIAEGPGAGIVTSSPAGLFCEASCDVDFAADLNVTLTAHATAGSGFAGWRGACTGRAECALSMSDARTVTAVFGVEVEHPLVARYGGTADDRIAAVGVDLAGHPIIAGSFGSTARFGTASVTSHGGSDGFIAKLSQGGAQVDWISTYGGADDDSVRAVATSIDTDVLVAGWYFGPADLFGESHAGFGGADPLLARLDPAGTRELAPDFGSTATDTAECAVFDDTGGAWVAGWALGPMTAGGITRGHVGGADAYLIHYDVGGAADHVEVFGGTGDDRVLDIDRSPRGDRIAIFGVFQQSLSFGGAPITSTAAYGLFVATFDDAGEAIWSKGFGVDADSEPFIDGAFDPDGNLVIAGGFYGDLDLGDQIRRSAGDLDAFVAKLSSDGELLWAQTFGGPGPDAFFDVRADSLGDLVLGGGFNGVVAFGADPLASAGGWDAVLVKLDADGRHIWSRRLGGRDLDVILAVGLDVAGTVVAGGHFGGTVDFGTTVLTSAGSQDAFVITVGR